MRSKAGSLPIALLMVLALLVPGPVAAQDAPVGTVYFTDTEISNSWVDPAAQDVCGSVVYAATPEAPAAGAAYGAPSYLGSGCQTWFDYVPTGDIQLEGGATLTAIINCDLFSVSYPAGISSIRAQLFANGGGLGSSVTVFGGSGPCVAGNAEETHVFTLETEDVALAAGDTLSVRITWWRLHLGGTGHDMHFVVGPEGSRLEAAGLLPGAAVADAPEPEVVVEELAGDTLALDAEFVGGNETRAYTWNVTGNQSLDLAATADLSNGTVNITITDSANGTVFAALLSGNESATQTVDVLANDTWSITLEAQDAAGLLSLSGAPTPPVEETQDTDADSDGNETAQPQSNEEGDQEAAAVPGPGLALVAVAVLGAVLARRRRP